MNPRSDESLPQLFIARDRYRIVISSSLPHTTYSRSQVDMMHCSCIVGRVLSATCLLMKIWVYQTLVLPVHLYARETWSILAAYKTPGSSFSREVQTPNNQDPLAGPCQKLGINQSRPSVGSHHAPLEFCLSILPGSPRIHQPIKWSSAMLTDTQSPPQIRPEALPRPSQLRIYQLCKDNNTPPADLWRSIKHGHLGVPLLSSPTALTMTTTVPQLVSICSDALLMNTKNSACQLPVAQLNT